MEHFWASQSSQNGMTFAKLGWPWPWTHLPQTPCLSLRGELTEEFPATSWSRVHPQILSDVGHWKLQFFFLKVTTKTMQPWRLTNIFQHSRWAENSQSTFSKNHLSIRIQRIPILDQWQGRTIFQNHVTGKKNMSTWLIYLSSWTSKRFDAGNLHGRLRIQRQDWFDEHFLTDIYDKESNEPTKSLNPQIPRTFTFHSFHFIFPKSAQELRTTWTMFSEGMSQFNSTMTCEKNTTGGIGNHWKRSCLKSENFWSPKNMLLSKDIEEGRSVSIFIKSLGGCMWCKDRFHLLYAALCSTAYW